MRELDGPFSYSLKNYLLGYLLTLPGAGNTHVLPAVTEFAIQ